ncbi:MAG: tRNA pseudouridine(55) synthase TruB [Bacteroidales bacterium]|nr:tRNA pseudouridine(55) synthase TruB [Bacteroidales bacterium]MCM1415831.1 tRNA pseudouridine(55) synthase TruB [bacterium]MCM1423592.1 tRNA pseudouridine(55) synthase TruB [bacterium]
MYNGILNVYKENGFTSHDVVAKVRGITGEKKVGHTGTLDPDAVGVLPVCFGPSTKLSSVLTDWDKEYVAVMQLGITTDTQDISGQVLSAADEEALEKLDEKTVREAVMYFQGGYEQTPPMYSARKVNGKKLYKLARAGKEVERKARPVTISELEITQMMLPFVRIRVVCGKGTYIRTLCHDIGERLHVGAVMLSLVRNRVGILSLDDALPLSEIEKLRDEGKIADAIIPPDAVLETKRAVAVTEEEALRLLQNGNRIPETFLQGAMPLENGEEIRMYDKAGRFYGLYRYQARAHDAKPVKMFLSE